MSLNHLCVGYHVSSLLAVIGRVVSAPFAARLRIGTLWAGREKGYATQKPSQADPPGMGE